MVNLSSSEHFLLLPPSFAHEYLEDGDRPGAELGRGLLSRPRANDPGRQWGRSLCEKLRANYFLGHDRSRWEVGFKAEAKTLALALLPRERVPERHVFSRDAPSDLSRRAATQRIFSYGSRINRATINLPESLGDPVRLYARGE